MVICRTSLLLLLGLAALVGCTPTESGPGGFLTGLVTRSVDPVGTAQGQLIVVIFAQRPTGGEGDIVAGTFFDDVDLSEDGSSFEYLIDRIPPRSERYYVASYLDENAVPGQRSDDAESGDLTNLEPDTGDVQTMVIDDYVTFELDIDLSRHWL